MTRHRPGRQHRRGQQVRIDVPEASAEQLVGLGELLEQPEDLAATCKVTQRKFTGHPRMGEHAAVLE